VFKHYLNNEKATNESFVGSWFKTGDIAEISTDGYYKILGRSSSDIIKVRVVTYLHHQSFYLLRLDFLQHSGFKISALEIERELLSHHNVRSDSDDSDVFVDYVRLAVNLDC
jgi:malonyl-CoA/methylmalonyl-CoA synthetase